MARPADRRAKIELLRAAEAVFSEHGLAAAKVEDITARAGVSKGAFYLHFESKEDCWNQITESFLAKLADRCEPPDHEAHASDEQTLLHWHEHDCEVLEFCWENRALMGMLLAGGGGSPYAYLVDEFAERLHETIKKAVLDGMRDGLYRGDVDPELAAVLLAGAYDRLVRKLIREPKRPDIPAWSMQAMTIFTSGLLCEGLRKKQRDSAVTLRPDSEAQHDEAHPRRRKAKAR